MDNQATTQFTAYTKGKQGDKRLTKAERKQCKQVRQQRKNKGLIWQIV